VGGAAGGNAIGGVTPRGEVAPRGEVGPRTIGDLAIATADFRDQFYGLRGCIVENREDCEWPRLVTTGLVDPAWCRWGEAATRIDKQRWQRPRLDLELLSRDPELALWAAARLVPKILLATQTKVLEAAVDERGEWLPVTPLITVVPRAGVDIWLVAAALLSPVLTAWSVMHYAGAGLSASAIKLSARQVMGLPAPPRECAEWDEAAVLVREASAEGVELRRRELLVRAGRLMCAAYGVAGARGELISWWEGRWPRREPSAAGDRRATLSRAKTRRGPAGHPEPLKIVGAP
jgi:hypothetical protein